MAQDFRASQFRGAKFITSGSSAGGAKLVFYDISADSTVTPNQGTINTAKFNTSSIGTDVFMYVSGTVFGSGAPQVTVLPDTVLSGNITFRSGSGDTNGELGQGLHWIGLGDDGDDAQVTLYKAPGSVPILNIASLVGDVAYYAGSGVGKHYFYNGAAVFNAGLSGSLTKLTDGSSYITAGANVTVVSNSNGGITISATTGSGGGGGGGGSLQQAYYSGSQIVLTASVGGVRISGNPGTNSGSLEIISDGSNTYRALGIWNSGVDREIILIRGGNSGFGGGAICLRNQGGVTTPINFVEGTGDLSTGTATADIQYVPSDNALKFKVTGTKNMWFVDGGSFGGNLLTMQNANAASSGAIYLLPDKAAGIVHNSGSLRQSGSAVFYNGLSGSLTKLKDGTSYLIAGSNVTITTGSNGAVTIASTGGGSTQWVESSTSPRLRTTASVAIGSGSVFAQDIGSNVAFYVSGTRGGSTHGTKVAVLPNTVFSGTLFMQQSSTSTEPSIRFFTSGGLDVANIRMDTLALPNTGVLVFGNDSANAYTLVGGGDKVVLTADQVYLAPTYDFTFGQVSGIGTDAGVIVSGAVGGKAAGTAKSVALFVGDTHTSGTFHMNNSAVVNSKLTTNADGTLWTLNMSSSAVYDIDLTIIAVGTSSLGTKRFKRNLVAYTSGSTAAIMENTVFAPVLDVSGSSAASAWDVGFTVSGSSLLTTVTGTVGQLSTWTMKAEYTFGGNA